MTLESRLAGIDWERARARLDERGYATTPPILTPEECATLIALYERRECFRSKVDMARLRFGLGEYKYFSAPLPPLVATLRATLYPAVAAIANDWMAALRVAERFPPALEAFLDHCHRHGQTKPTPLMLRYSAGGYNCLHQDLYGEVVFPLQFTFMLSRPAVDFRGGEFLLMEQRPRAQSRGDAIGLEPGAAILFPTRYRPVRGARGCYRVNVRHGVATLEAGTRFTLGIIFHDAK
ncbi:MAG: 2OG-Fe(II) oxygenase [Candidatus Binataceae bacterium]